MRSPCLVALAVFALVPACQQDRTSPTAVSSSGATDAAASGAANTLPPPPPPTTPVGPGSTKWSFDDAATKRAQAPTDARRVAARELLRGRHELAALPELASDPGVTLETGLEGRLLRPAGRALVTIAKLEIVGQLEREEARVRIEQTHERLESCYARTLVERPTLRGTAIFKFTVAWEGNVDRVELASSDLGDAWMVECLRRSIEGIRFDEAEAAPLAEQDGQSAAQLVLQFDAG
jgi:hypothetical protein